MKVPINAPWHDVNMQMELPPPCPWSKNQLRNLGRRIRDSGDEPDASPRYEDVLGWYDELAAFVSTFLWECDWTPLLGERAPQVVSRVKTMDTLRDKLIRSPNFPLPAIQDIAGVRFEAEMTLDEQDAVVTAVTGYFEDLGWQATVTDYRDDGGHSGYRAVHIVLALDPVGKVEIQVRTHLQGKWANVYEALADRIGRHIRYDELPDDPESRETVEVLQTTSLETIAKIENFKMDIGRLDASQMQDGVKRSESLSAEVRSIEEGLLETFRQIEESFRKGA